MNITHFCLVQSSKQLEKEVSELQDWIRDFFIENQSMVASDMDRNYFIEQVSRYCWLEFQKECPGLCRLP